MATPAPRPAAAGQAGTRRRAAGRTVGERKRQRREAMVAAALDLVGTRGLAQTTIEDVCRRAGVSTRNFYEEFGDRDGLLAAVDEQLVAALFAVWSGPVDAPGTSPAAVLRARVANVVRVLADDPRLARVAFVELVGVSPGHERRRRELLDVFPDWLESYMRAELDAAGVPARRRRALAIAAFAGAHELVARWALQPPEHRSDADELVDDIVAIGGATFRARRDGPGA